MEEGCRSASVLLSFSVASCCVLL